MGFGSAARSEHLMPNGLAVMLRAYKSALAQPPDETRAAFGPSHRYAQVAEQIEQRILDGEWKPGQRIPPVHAFTKTYGASERTTARAIHALALKDILTLERGAYYVAARG
jgi:DNA-binding GntR family transcriptional regulator